MSHEAGMEQLNCSAVEVKIEVWSKPLPGTSRPYNSIRTRAYNIICACLFLLGLPALAGRTSLVKDQTVNE